MHQQNPIFDIAVGFVMSPDIEGRYVNDLDDHGGETNFGISKRSYPDLNIAELTADQARDIYQRDYWRLIKCHELPPLIAIAVFDYAVQHGQFKAIKFLQIHLGVRVDGVNGPKTQATANRQTSDFISQLLSHRALFYTDLVKADSSRAKYLRGWLRRIILLSRYIAHTEILLYLQRRIDLISDEVKRTRVAAQFAERAEYIKYDNQRADLLEHTASYLRVLLLELNPTKRGR